MKAFVKLNVKRAEALFNLFDKDNIRPKIKGYRSAVGNIPPALGYILYPNDKSELNSGEGWYIVHYNKPEAYIDDNNQIRNWIDLEVYRRGEPYET